MKKDILNTVLSLGIMFLVGGCVMITVIIQSNSGTGLSPVMTNTLDDLSKGKRSVNFAPKIEKDKPQSKHENKATSDTTEQKEARRTKDDDASQ